MIRQNKMGFKLGRLPSTLFLACDLPNVRRCCFVLACKEWQDCLSFNAIFIICYSIPIHGLWPLKFFVKKSIRQGSERRN